MGIDQAPSRVLAPDELLEWWFSDAVRPLWFRSTPQFDAEVTIRCLATLSAARRGDLSDWAHQPGGALALVITLDQLPLNMFRGEPESFASEAEARRIAGRAIDQGFDAGLTDEGKAFLYMPFMHSETLADQDRSVELYAAAGLSENLKFARHHRDIVARFGRFPHRNAILGRKSTPEELAYLDSPGAFRG